MTEAEAMAREIAADKHVDGSGYYNESMREIFIKGWDAAMEYAGKIASEGIEHLDDEMGSRS